MQFASKEYIINTVFKTNTLPIISECNTSCIFCSHKQNPDEIDVFRMPKLNLSDFEEIIEFMSPDKKIVIGEAATRIIEGEPLLHKDFINIIGLVRKKFPHTLIQITTNGILLSEDLINKLVELGGIELNISVNCINPEKRRQVLGIAAQKDITAVLKMLNGKIKFSGSCVIIPDVLDFTDIEELISVLDENGAEQVRVFLPGYTSISEKQVELLKVFEETHDFIQHFINKYSVPIIIEPSFIKDLNCRVEGVIKDTPAYEAQILAGDIIVSVNNVKAKTRVDAFDRVFRAVDPTLKIKRNDKLLYVKINKKKGSSPGFITLYDIAPDFIKEANEVAKRHNAENVLFLSSRLAIDILDNYLKQNDACFGYRIACIKNNFFGGNISCAGLLTVQDIIEQAATYFTPNNKPDLILLPKIMFDFKGRDLLRRSIDEIEKELHVKIDKL
jgi:wyosine [tRNA(Phe)-imidazoG37] synthetase (radical SAM superfamily)